ncbi:hypothetical protein ACQP1S_24385 [Micromonospora matsumotoense]|uniref:hypothetical protein n=1 Tax=Micromonospora matsumotoense TaxID=121616 RepID=UPI003D8F5C62
MNSLLLDASALLASGSGTSVEYGAMLTRVEEDSEQQLWVLAFGPAVTVRAGLPGG